jgi:uncharacterized membrane protein
MILAVFNGTGGGDDRFGSFVEEYICSCILDVSINSVIWSSCNTPFNMQGIFIFVKYPFTS